METNEHNNTALRLQELSESDFEIVDGQPHVIGWSITTTAGQEIGVVHDLIFDKEAKKVRYVVGSIQEKIKENSELVLIPIGILDLHEKNNEVIMPEVSNGYLNTLPVYVKGTIISPAEELAIRYAFLGKDGLTELDEDKEKSLVDFYEHEHFNDERFRRSRSAD
jgi:sporulation protein YlmC with PRC-barrel domain